MQDGREEGGAWSSGGLVPTISRARIAQIVWRMRMVMIEIEKMMMIVKQNDNDVDKNNDVDVGA